jgi:hypothetical protein
MSATTLPTDPTVTIYLDGLMLLLHGDGERLCQALVHTGADHHELKIEVWKSGNPSTLEWPNDTEKWNGSHECIQRAAPFWLYVDSGQGRPPRPGPFSASLYKPNDLSDALSFGHILDFESKLYPRPMTFQPDASDSMAQFNFTHGTFYSAALARLKRMGFHKDDEQPDDAVYVDRFPVSILGAADIADKSEMGTDRFIVLEQTKPDQQCNPKQELFRFKLQAGTHYIIKVRNVPIHPMTGSPARHFLLYYKLLSLLPGEQKFFLKPEDRPEMEVEDSHQEDPPEMKRDDSKRLAPESPPCNLGQGSETLPQI